MLIIHTPRLELFAAMPDILRAEAANRSRFADLLSARVPESWPPENNDASTMRYFLDLLLADSANAGWTCWYMIRREGPLGRLAIGNSGFKGKPDANGVVEIGYSILPQYRRQGYGTEAVGGLLTHAFRHAEVRKVIAETYPTLLGSIGVLAKNGFRLSGPGSEEGAIRYELLREEYEAGHADGRA